MKADDFKLKGLVVPVPTPFGENGAVDLGAFLSHLDWLAECGVSNLLINGTTGEFFSLTHNEQILLLETARSAWTGPLIFHLGGSALSQALDSACAAQGEGADFVAALPPFYFSGAPAEGIVDWFGQLAVETDLPLILYNFPKHTANSLTPKILFRIPHWGMKDSSGDLGLIPSTPNYFVGGDRKISAAYAAGAKGFVSASSNVDPGLYLRIEKERTPESQAAVDAVNKTFSGAYAIARIKQHLSEILPGYPPYVRPPLRAE